MTASMTTGSPSCAGVEACDETSRAIAIKFDHANMDNFDFTIITP
jgi:hypothetical protein